MQKKSEIKWLDEPHLALEVKLEMEEYEASAVASSSMIPNWTTSTLENDWFGFVKLILKFVKRKIFDSFYSRAQRLSSSLHSARIETRASPFRQNQDATTSSAETNRKANNFAKLRIRRHKANARERNRMHGLNEALDLLRK